MWSAARSAKISMILCMPERVSGGDAKFQGFCDRWYKWEGQPKWVARWRATGSVAPDRMGGSRRRRLETHWDLVLRLVGETPHLTIDRLRDLLAADGVAVCRDTIWRFLRREGLRFKETPVRP